MSAARFAPTMMVVIVALGLTLAPPLSAARSEHAGAPEARAAKTTLRTFAGSYVGHTRMLTISSSGVAKEALDSGCCDKVLRLTLKLSHPHDTPRGPSAKARITKVVILDPDVYSDDYPAPKVGQTGTLRLSHGIIHEPFTKTTYCTLGRQRAGACGA